MYWKQGILSGSFVHTYTYVNEKVDKEYGANYNINSAKKVVAEMRQPFSIIYFKC